MIRTLLQRTGPRPVLLVRYLAFKVRRRRLDARLRTGYESLVVAVPGGARLRRAPLDLPPRDELPAQLREEADRVRAEAELVAQGRVSFLGSGLVRLGPDVDWQRDFKSGYRWPTAFYQDLEVTRLSDDSDAKMPWELSRGHQFLTLARAAALDRDERAARELERQLGGWIDANPPGYGINWVNPMEVAIRAVNWIWAIRTLESWRPLEPELRRRVTRSLQAHARHIFLNLEGSPLLRSNHYLADILGLLALGSFLEHDRGAPRWFAYAHRSFEQQILVQVLLDGTGFEASTSYHGLALEIFLLARVLAAEAGRPFSPRYDERLEAMLDASAAIRHPDGRNPLFGDGDSGRILPGGFARPATHDPLLWLGTAILGRERPTTAAPDPEVAWTLGVEAWRRADALPPPGRALPSAFPAGGLYVLRGGDCHLVVRCGDVGQNGAGGHAHNDPASYELSLGGVSLVVDAGTYAYTADPAARDAFRSTRAHNTVVVDGVEVNPLPEGVPFQLPQLARVAVEEWHEGPELVRLVVSHDGYRRLAGSPLHRRTFELDRASGGLTVRDEVLGRGRHLVESLLHLSPGTTVTAAGESTFELALDRVHVRLELGEGVEVEVGEGWVSSEFGVRERAPLLVSRRTGELPLRLGHTFSPAPASDIPARTPSLAEAPR